MFVAHANRWLTARRGLAVAVAALAIGIQMPSADAAKRKKLSKPAQPMTLVVDLARQRVTGYAGAERIWSSRISSGKRGHRTPTGVFSIIQKRSRHFSNIYNNAPMPHMQRITWSGIAFHGGPIPGYPASHGCIRLPYGQARRLFRLTRMQTRAIVTYSSPRPTLISHANLWNKLPVGSDPEPSDPSDPPVERVPETAPGADDAPVATTGRTVERQTARLLNSVVGGGAAGQPVTNIAARIDGAAVGDDGRDPGDSASREVAVVGPPKTQKEARRRLEAGLAGHRSRVTVAESRVRLAKAIVKAHGTKLLTLNKRRRQTIRALAKAKRMARRSERSAKRVKAAMTRLLKANVKIDPETDTFADLAVREAALEERLDRSEADLRISNAEVAELTGTLGRIDDEREIMKPKLASARLEFRELGKRLLAEKRALETAEDQITLFERPVHVLISRTKGKIYFRQGFKDVFEADVAFREPEKPIGTHVFTVIDQAGDDTSLRWSAISVPDRKFGGRTKSKRLSRKERARLRRLGRKAPAVAPAPRLTATAALDRLIVSDDVAQRLRARLKVGSSVIVSDRGKSHETGKGTDFVVLTR